MGVKERKQREKIERLNSIVEAAEKVIFERGYEQASVDMIAKTAELSKGTIYLYFKTKEDIYFRISERGKTKLLRYLSTASKRANNGFDKIMAMANAYLDFYKEEKNYFEAIFYQESLEVKINSEDPFFKSHTIDDFLQEASPLTVLLDALNLGVEDGSIRKDIKPLVTAFTIWSQATGVIQLMKVRGTYIDVAFKIKREKLWANFMDLLKISIAAQ